MLVSGGVPGACGRDASRPGEGLMPGHGRNHVVEDDQHETVVVVDGVGDPGQTGVEQRAVADEADDALFRPHRQFRPAGMEAAAPMHTPMSAMRKGGMNPRE